MSSWWLIPVVFIIVFVVVRILLKSSVKELSERITLLRPYIADEDCVFEFTGIISDLDRTFCGKFVSSTQEKVFSRHYVHLYNELCRIVWWTKLFHVDSSEIISRYIDEYESIDVWVKRHNEEVRQYTLKTHKDFFDTCLTYPLDEQQRRSIVSEEDNCLVVSGAGSGKTSTIVGKVKYLTEIKGIAPEKILLISYANKAANELTSRIATDGIRGYTFHKLAIDIIGQVTGIKPLICDNAEAMLVKTYNALLEDANFKNNVIEYFFDYQIPINSKNQQEWEERNKLAEQKRVKLKALLPDMDGNAIYVRSEQERKICFVLSSLGVRFRYEEPYEYPLADETHSQYRPDFSIYFEKDGKTRRVYLEHFGVDEHSCVPLWFAEERGISYEEANKKYNDGITWKKFVHESRGTMLIASSSADFGFFDIKKRLRESLEEAGVPIQEKSEAYLYNAVVSESSVNEKVFIRLASAFIMLLKSSCKSIDEILGEAQSKQDKQSEFVIKNIFKPMYSYYTRMLREGNMIDFTDAILVATKLCKEHRPVEYDYIIVDEFQDISVDRYNFLKSLRDGNPPAKLYCVGDDWQSIYRFSGSDIALFNKFSDYFGATEINKIETTFRFGEPLVTLSTRFIQRNESQIKKDVHPFNEHAKTELAFLPYNRITYGRIIEEIVSQIPLDKSILLIGRYSFDDYYLSQIYRSVRKSVYVVCGREIEFLTVHKSKGLEADYVILLQCNRDKYGFPSLVGDDSVLSYVLTEDDDYPNAEERRLFYVAITRAKIKTFVLYDENMPSEFVDEFISGVCLGYNAVR